MTLIELALNNFGVFQGEHSLCFTSDDGANKPAPGRTLILIGGRNGSGKTTVLEAILLALYGKRSPGVRRQAGSYEAFLRGMISKGAATSASVRLRLQGLPGYYGKEVDVARAWSLQPRGVHETFQVITDGWVDDVLTQQWHDHIERVAPLSVSNLFFFDGERIEDFADPTRAATAIENSLKSLMGVNEVVQLRKDLAVFRQRQLAGSADLGVKEELEYEFAEVQRLAEEREELLNSRARTQTELDYSTKLLETERGEFERSGGDLYRQREALHVQLERAKEKHWNLEMTTTALAASATSPAAASKLLLQSAMNRAEKQMVQAEEHFASHAVRRHAPRLLKRASKELELSDTQARELDEILGDEFSTGDTTENFNPESLGHVFGSLYDLRRASHESEESLGRFEVLLAQYSEAGQKLDEMEAAIASLPTDKEIAQISQKVSELEKHGADLKASMDKTEEKLGLNERKLDEAQVKYRKTVTKVVDTGLASVEAQNAVEAATNADETLQRIERSLKSRLLRRLEQEIVIKSGLLLGKSGLVRTVVISDSDFQPQIYNDKNETVRLFDLSAGERQLFALAMLWSFAEIAEVHLPMVIDTPLGRLDRKHRHHFVDRFLPNASHQTLILSTDEEIKEGLYDRLCDSVLQEYTITYDASVGGSRIDEGYAFARPEEMETTVKQGEIIGAQL